MSETVTLSNGLLTIPIKTGISSYQATKPPAHSKAYYEVTATWSGYACLRAGYTKNDGLVAMYLYENGIRDNGTLIRTPSKWLSPATFGLCLDKDSHTFTVYYNGLLEESYVLNSSTVNSYAEVGNWSSFLTPCQTVTVNFGATPFKYPIPKGYTSYDGNQNHTNKYLLQNTEGYRNLTEFVSTDKPTEKQFLEKGMDDIPAYDQLAECQALVVYATDRLSKTLVHFTPKEKIIRSSEKINLGRRSLKEVALTGTDTVRILFSKDDGVTWSNKRDLISLDNMFKQGLSPEQLLALTKEEWQAFLGKAKSLRFAYGLLDETANTDKLVLTLGFSEE